MSIWKKFKEDTEKNVPDENAIYKLKQQTEIQMRKKANKTSHNLRKFGIATSIGCAVLAILICIPTVFIPIVLDRARMKDEETDKTPISSISIPTALDYAEIIEYLQSHENNTSNDGFLGIPELSKGEANGEANVDYAAGGTASASAPSATPDFSDTNNQVENVAEADIIKTDGRYIYTISSSGNVNITSATNGTLEYVSHITPPEDETSVMSAQEIFIVENRLIVICNSYEKSSNYPYSTSGDTISIPEYYSYYYQMNSKTIVNIYDTTNKAEPVQIDSLLQNGTYISSRMIGDKLYLITRDSVPTATDLEIVDFIPRTTDNGTENLLPPSKIYICPEFEYRGFLIVSGIDTTIADFVSTVATVGSGYNVYASQNNIYVITSTYRETIEEIHYSNYNLTLISRFSIDNGTVKLESAGEVLGNILNQFSLDEYNGYLRVVTTVNKYEYDIIKNFDIFYGSYQNVQSQTNERHNSVYILDLGMNVVGQISDIAKDERVYSVRFAKELCYFVTFRQVDPLFAVDLTEPTNPQILSALKIPGFSDYLHPYGDGLLFGLGRDVTETGSVGGLKLSMFDITDPKDISEISKYVLNSVYYSEASYNHKAILINSEKNIIAFQGNNDYLTFSYDKTTKKFIQTGVINIGGTNWSWSNMRGLYIGDYLYIFSNKTLISFDINNNFSQADNITLK